MAKLTIEPVTNRTARIVSWTHDDGKRRTDYYDHALRDDVDAAARKLREQGHEVKIVAHVCNGGMGCPNHSIRGTCNCPCHTPWID